MRREKPMSLPDLAGATGYSYRQIREWTHRAYDPLPSVPVGTHRQRRVYMSDFETWVLREKARLRRAVR